jgi:hypothetical protein
MRSWSGRFRNVSSVGSERCFDRAEVTGSSPVRSTFLLTLTPFYSSSIPTSLNLLQQLKMKAYQVTINFDWNDEFAALIPAHRTYINMLINKNVIDQYVVSMESQRVWVTLNAATKTEVEKILKKSPLFKYWTYEIDELFVVDGQLYRLPAVTPN